MSITTRPFGQTAQGETVTQYILTNKTGATVKLINYGANLTSLTVPDREGKLADVVTGFDTLEGYLKPHGSMGDTIGRYGNRIAKGRFTLDGVTYQLAINNGENHLHGGLWASAPSCGKARPWKAWGRTASASTWSARTGTRTTPAPSPWM